jgi:hypothetical protein
MIILILGLMIIISVLAIILGIPCVVFYIHKKTEMRETKVNAKDFAIPSSAEWYYGHGQSVHGPIRFNQLCQLYCRGTITAKTLMWTNELEDWTPLGQLGCYHNIRHLQICQKLFLSLLLIGCPILLIVIGYIIKL